MTSPYRDGAPQSPDVPPRFVRTDWQICLGDDIATLCNVYYDRLTNTWWAINERQRVNVTRRFSDEPPPAPTS